MADIQDLAEKLVARALRLGADACDVAAVSSSVVVAEMERGSVKQASTIRDTGVGIRVFRQGSPGFACATGTEMGRALKSLELAVSQARAGTPDPAFKDLPCPGRATRTSGLYDRRIADLQPAEVVEMAIELTDAARTHAKIYSVNAGISAGSCQAAFCNSNGITRRQSFTAFEIGAESVAKDGEVMFSGMDASWGRRLQKSEVVRVGQTASSFAMRGLRRTRIPTGDYAVVLDPIAAGHIFAAAIGGGANADSVQRGRSYLGGKVGKAVGGDSLTVWDDSTVDWLSGSFSFDGEGTPARRKAVIERGVLRSLLHDSYTAGKDCVRSTGNSSRGGALWSYRRPPSIAPSNLIVSPGNSSLDEMLEETRRGVYLRVTYDHPNLATGEFSGMMMESFVIQDGALGDSILQSTIGIDLLEMYRRIDLKSRETRYAFGVSVPYMRVSRARIGGSG